MLPLKPSNAVDHTSYQVEGTEDKDVCHIYLFCCGPGVDHKALVQQNAYIKIYNLYIIMKNQPQKGYHRVGRLYK